MYRLLNSCMRRLGNSGVMVGVNSANGESMHGLGNSCIQKLEGQGIKEWSG